MELRTMVTWKAPGRQKKEHFWVKQCRVSHKYYNRSCQAIPVKSRTHMGGAITVKIANLVWH